MTQKPDLSIPLAKLLQFSGQHFTAIRALTWTALNPGSDRFAEVHQINQGADAVHNLSRVGWDVIEYVEGRASGKALLHACRSVLSEIEAVKAQQPAEERSLFHWKPAIEALEDIISKVEIVEVDGDDVLTTDEHMEAAMKKMRAEILQKREAKNAQ